MEDIGFSRPTCSIWEGKSPWIPTKIPWELLLKCLCFEPWIMNHPVCLFFYWSIPHFSRGNSLTRWRSIPSQKGSFLLRMFLLSFFQAMESSTSSDHSSRPHSLGSPRFHVLQLLRHDPCDEEEAMRRDNCMNNTMEVGHLARSEPLF